MMSGAFDHFSRKKSSSQAAQVPAGKATRSSAARSKQQETQQQQQQQQPYEEEYSPEERMLRAFDLDPKYGPCAGMTRMERWQRASKFGLDPPQDVLSVLSACAPDSALLNNLWYKRI